MLKWCISLQQLLVVALLAVFFKGHALPCMDFFLQIYVDSFSIFFEYAHQLCLPFSNCFVELKSSNTQRNTRQTLTIFSQLHTLWKADDMFCKVHVHWSG